MKKGWKKLISLVLCLCMITSMLSFQTTYADDEVASPTNEAETTYEVTFADYDGTLLETQTVASGSDAAAPVNTPTREGYQFTGWDKELTNVTGNMTVTAQYAALANMTVTVQYQFADGKMAAQSYVATIEDGEAFSATVTSPAVAGYTADKPSVTFDGVTAGQTVTVTYTANTNTTYTVNHYKQTAAGIYELADTESFAGTTGANTAAAAKSYTGLDVQAFAQQPIAADGSTVIDIYYNCGTYYMVIFDAMGGSGVDSFVGLNGDSVTKPTDPTRPGYTFAGWYTAQTGGTAVNFGTLKVGTSNTTLYAHWTAKQTTYTVIHWQENANDDKYAFVENESKTGTTGTGTSAGAKSYDGFTANTITQEAIAGDGSTIVNVYYDRNEYSVKFHKYEEVITQVWVEGHYEYGRGGKHWVEGYYKDSTEYKWNEMADLTITAKYGADISNQWPSSTATVWGTKRGNQTGEQPYQSGISVMPLNGDSFYYVKQNGSNTMNLNYYLEVLGGTAGTATYDGKHYVLDHVDSFKSDTLGWVTSAEDHYAIAGFTYTKNLKDGSGFTKVPWDVTPSRIPWMAKSTTRKAITTAPLSLPRLPPPRRATPSPAGAPYPPPCPPEI